MHLAIIMDGNGRYGKKKYFSRSMGHRDGAEKLYDVCKWTSDLGVDYLTVYAFSTENWKRDKDEVDFLMKLFEEMFNKYIIDSKDNNIKINVIGNSSTFSDKLQNLIIKAHDITKDCTGLTLNIALNYGGRDEIVHATKKIIDSNISLNEINENTFSNYLDTFGIPAVDLMVRTGGEYRLSNFLLWQLSYSELFFTPTLWPEFSYNELKNIIDSFKNRNRRFGGIQKSKD